MRIGLIAMSGVRACDAELMEIGLTFPGVVERSQVIASLPSLGLLTLAGMTPPEHTCRYIEVHDLRNADALPTDFDFVAISSLSAQIFEAYELADRFRAAGVPVVLGGLHVSALPDEALAHADAVVVGEGEPAWPQVLHDAEHRVLHGCYRATGQFDLAHSPMPAYELLDMGQYNRMTVQASRGCPLRCDYCASSILIAPNYRQKPVERVLAEIDRIHEFWRRPFIEFADDNAFVNKKYWKRLLPELAERRIRWFAETDLSVYQDGELLAMMRASGCVQVLIGFESPTEGGLRGLELRHDRKRRWWPHYKEAIQRIQSHGIRVNGCFVLGLDGHGPEVFNDVYDFAVETELFDVQITLQTPFPGTPLLDRLRREDRMLYDKQWQRCTLFDVMFAPQRMSAEELRCGFRELVRRLYAEDTVKWRRENFNRKYLRTVSTYEEVLE
ncbi:MAG: B12-binding domain-containing radical SAM protein [Pirellulales bacterium]|nr:B12-binding domain-containing radical SAM protein [Pirellulales bacterium]